MGKGNNTTTQTTAPNPVAGAAYNSIIGQAGQVASTPYQPYTGELVAPINTQQQTGIENINENANFASPYIQAALDYGIAGATPITAQQIQQYSSPYTTDVVNATQNQFNNQNEQQQQGLIGNLVAQGALGGNRVGVAQANLANQQQLAQAPVIAGLENQGYTTGLNTALTEQQAEAQGAYSIGNLGVSGQNAALSGATAQFGAGTAEQTTQQALDTALYQQYINQMAYPFQTTQWLAGIDTGVGSQLGGTSTTTTPPPNPWNSIVGLGEAGIGAAGTYAGDAAIAAALWTGGVAERADGGVANHYPTVPESPHTLVAQRRQLINGHRKAQMYPHGTPELPVPDGMRRVKSHGGVFHYDPKKIDEKTIHHLSAHGRENHILDLGPFSKNEVMELLRKGHQGINVVERNQHGHEVRAAVGTHLTVPHQLAAMRKTASPGHTVHLENPHHTLMSRVEHHHRAMGGRIRGYDTGGAPYSQATNGIAGTPYAGASGFVPTNSITHGSGPPRPPQAPQQQQSPNISAQASQIGNIAKALGQAKGMPQNILPSGVQNAPAQVGASVPEGLAPEVYSPTDFGGSAGAVYARGGGVANFADGGGDDQDYITPNAPSSGLIASDTLNVPSSGFLTPDVPVDDNPRPHEQIVDYQQPADGVAISGDVPLPRPRPQQPAVTASADGVAPVTESPPTVPSDNTGVLPPRGIRNNNPGNIEAGQFASSQPGYAGSDGRFAVYDSPEHGMNAASNLLNSYGQKGINTISGIVNRWAPAADNNDTGAYISAVSKETGIDPNQPLDMSDPNVRNKIAAAISHHENGAGVTTHGYDRAAPFTMPQHAMSFASDEPQHAEPEGVAPASSNFFAQHRDLWPALMAAGFRTMASRSPFLGVAVGEGGEQGMSQYEAEQSQHMNQSKIDLEAKKLDQELALENKKLAISTLPYSEMTANEKAELSLKERQPITIQTPIGPRSATKNPDGSYTDVISGDVYGRGGRQPAQQPQETPAPAPGPGGGAAPAPPSPSTPTSTAPATPSATAAAQPAEDQSIKTADGDITIPPNATLDEGDVPLNSVMRFDETSYPQGTRPEVLDQMAKEGFTQGQINRVRQIGLGMAAFPPTGRPGENQSLLAKAYEFNPNLDQGTYARRNAVQKFFAVGSQGGGGQNIAAMNTWAQHMNEYLTLAKKLDLGRFTDLNDAYNWLTSHGFTTEEAQRNLSAVAIAQKAVADEGAKVFAGSGSTLADREEWMNRLPMNVSFSVALKNAQTVEHLVEGRLSSLKDQYNEGMRTDHKAQEFLAPQTRAVIDSIRNADPDRADSFNPVSAYQLKKADGSKEESALVPAAKPEPAARFKQLIDSGMSKADAYTKMHQEGYN